MKFTVYHRLTSRYLVLTLRVSAQILASIIKQNEGGLLLPFHLSQPPTHPSGHMRGSYPPQSHAQNLRFPWTSHRRITLQAKPERGGWVLLPQHEAPPSTHPDFFELPPPAHPTHSGRGSYPPSVACGRAWFLLE
jgi:hypothetical protein